MGLDGDPDDYGLPKVDVVVPDDARELDRDVIAYRRELRQRRRRERWRKIASPFTRYGIAAPFIASAVLIALISGVLMTVISPRTTPHAIQVPPTGPPRLRAGDVGGPLPAGDILVDGKRTPIAEVIDVAGVVMIVPASCHCDPAAGNLAQQAGQQGLPVWLIADGRTGKAADDVRRMVGPALRAFTRVVEDPDRLFSTTFRTTGLTAVLVSTDRLVHEIIGDVPTTRDYTRDLQAVRTPS